VAACAKALVENRKSKIENLFSASSAHSAVNFLFFNTLSTTDTNLREVDEL
jgi:hypothetical protein